MQPNNWKIQEGIYSRICIYSNQSSDLLIKILIPGSRSLTILLFQKKKQIQFFHIWPKSINHSIEKKYGKITSEMAYSGEIEIRVLFSHLPSSLIDYTTEVSSSSFSSSSFIPLFFFS